MNKNLNSRNNNILENQLIAINVLTENVNEQSQNNKYI